MNELDQLHAIYGHDWSEWKVYAVMTYDEVLFRCCHCSEKQWLVPKDYMGTLDGSK